MKSLHSIPVVPPALKKLPWLAEPQGAGWMDSNASIPNAFETYTPSCYAGLAGSRYERSQRLLTIVMMVKERCAVPVDDIFGDRRQ